MLSHSLLLIPTHVAEPANSNESSGKTMTNQRAIKNTEEHGRKKDRQEVIQGITPTVPSSCHQHRKCSNRLPTQSPYSCLLGVSLPEATSLLHFSQLGPAAAISSVLAHLSIIALMPWLHQILILCTNSMFNR